MRLLLNSIPKSGTNLLQKILENVGLRYSGRSISTMSVLGPYALAKVMLRTDLFSLARGDVIPVGIESEVYVSARWISRRVDIKEGEYLTGHAPYSDALRAILEKRDLRVIQLVRHPLDVLVSWAHFAAEERTKTYPWLSEIRQLSFEERIRFFVSGKQRTKNNGHLNSFPFLLEQFVGWSNLPNVLVVRFEDLIGKDEFNKVSIRLQEVERLGDYLGLRVQAPLTGVYGDSHTFRRGVIGSANDELSPALRAELFQIFNQTGILRRLGYAQAQ